PPVPPPPKRGTDAALSIDIVTPWPPTLAKSGRSTCIRGPVRGWEFSGIGGPKGRHPTQLLSYPRIGRIPVRSSLSTLEHRVGVRVPVGGEATSGARSPARAAAEVGHNGRSRRSWTIRSFHGVLRRS